MGVLSFLSTSTQRQGVSGLHLSSIEHPPRFSHMGTILRFFYDITISSALNRSVQLDAPFAIFFIYSHITMRETTRQLCFRAAEQQAGARRKSQHGHGDRKRERSFSGLSK